MKLQNYLIASNACRVASRVSVCGVAQWLFVALASSSWAMGCGISELEDC